MNNPQLNKNGELQHLLSTEGLLTARILRDILDRAGEFVNPNGGSEIRKVPLLHGKSVFNIFSILVIYRPITYPSTSPPPPGGKINTAANPRHCSRSLH